MNNLLTMKDVEKMFNVSKVTLRRWDKSGKLVAVRTKGGHRRYKKNDIDKMLGNDCFADYGELYEHLCSAEYIAGKLSDENYEVISKIRQNVGIKLLKEHEKNMKL